MDENEIRDLKRSLGNLWGITLLLVGGGLGITIGLVVGYGFRDGISRILGA